MAAIPMTTSGSERRRKIEGFQSKAGSADAMSALQLGFGKLERGGVQVS